MKKKNLTLLTAMGMVYTSTVYADQIPTFDLNTGELHLPKVELLSSTGDSVGTVQAHLQQVREDPTRDFVVESVVSAEDESSNKHIARLFLHDMLSEGDLSVADDIMAADAVIHLRDSFTPDLGTGPEGMKNIVNLYRNTFPDLEITIDEVITAGDKVISRFTINGTQEGDLPGIPATGIKVSITGTDIYHIKNGEILEFWHDADTLGLMKQLGAVPENPPADSSVVAKNKNIAQLFLRDMLSEGDLSVADDIMASDAVIHLVDSFTPDLGNGPDGMKNIVDLYRNTFPDLEVVVDEVIATEDKAISRFTINGTQEGDLPGISATGIKVSVAGMDIYHIKDGKIVEFWHDADTLGLMKQLGAVPENPPADSSVIAKNKNIAQLFLRDLLSEGDLNVADDIMASDAVIHLVDSFTPDLGNGPEGMKNIVGLYRNTFPDLDVVVDEVIATEDKVISRFTINGTQEGDLPGIPATGLKVSITGMDIYHIKDGKIIEFWHDADTLGLMKQLGVVPE